MDFSDIYFIKLVFSGQLWTKISINEFVVAGFSLILVHNRIRLCVVGRACCENKNN